MSAPRPALRALAERLGILSSYRDVDGRIRETADPTREALVAAMGRDVDDEVAAARELGEIEREAASRMLDPVLVWREWTHGNPVAALEVGAGEPGREYALEIHLEDGGVVRGEGRLPQAGDDGRIRVPLPARPPHGYHEVRLEIAGGGDGTIARQRLVMAPRSAFPPEAAIGEGAGFGLWCNLYSLRSASDWGHGRLVDLARIGRFAGRMGADFVGINPLHAVGNRGLSVAPYSPTSRLFRNVLYLDPESVPELCESPDARARLTDPALCERRRALRARDRIDQEAVLAEILPVLRDLHGTFQRAHAGRDTPRDRAYQAYRRREGRELDDFAAWEVLAETRGLSGDSPRYDWRAWPVPLRDPRSPAVAAFRQEHAADVDFRRWLQFELDRQLAEAARALGAAGCRIGVYQDLALGAGRDSADTWMAAGLYASGARLGAPPDDYARGGQDWGLPPLDPHRLRDDGYRHWSRLLRAAFTHSGALRVDHAMGLMRQFWIPEGRDSADGAYVAYRADELLAVLALESRRHEAVVIAEDLGTVPPELPGTLEDWGLLRSAVLGFQRGADGELLPAERYPARAVASAGTHDLVPLPGFWTGADLDLREDLGLFERTSDAEAGRRQRDADRHALLRSLRAAGLGPASDTPSAADVVSAVHGFLAATPSKLVAVSLDDLAGETEPVNLPGVPIERHRSWSRRMTRDLDELLASPDAPGALAPLSERSRRGRSGG